MAHAVCAMSDCLTQEEATQHLIPMVSILLKNNSTEVIVSLVENMHSLIGVVKGNQQAIEEKILPALTTLSGDKTWRIRFATVQFMPKLATIIGAEMFTAKL